MLSALPVPSQLRRAIDGLYTIFAQSRDGEIHQVPKASHSNELFGFLNTIAFSRGRIGGKDLLCGFLILILLYALGRSIYNLYFHPLSSFPGPRFAACSHVYKTSLELSGNFFKKSLQLHQKYGPVVRLAPNQLSFSTPSAYREIYSHPRHGPTKFIKSPSYNVFDLKLPSSIITESNPEKHAQQKKILAPAFSTKSLMEHEEFIVFYVDLLIKQLGRYGEGGKKPLDVNQWYNSLTFDIIGDLAFGEPFGCLERGELQSWVALIVGVLKVSSVMVELLQYPWLRWFMMALFRENIGRAVENQQVFVRERLRRRLAKGRQDGKRDIVSQVAENKQDDEKEEQAMTYGENELVSEMNSLVLAGSETTAAFLVGCTCFLTQSQNAHYLRTLTTLIRTTFSHPSQITSGSTSSLLYLNCIINESLRLFPPAPLNLRRIATAGTTIDNAFIPPTTEVYCSVSGLTRSEKYFHLPKEFHPERWFGDHDSPHNGSGETYIRPEEFKDDVRDASEPFGVGPRACLGRNLAWMEMRVTLAKLVWWFDLEMARPEDGYLENAEWMERLKVYNMWLKGPLWVRFRERQDLKELKVALE